jgi:hypothetical protein
MNEDRPKIGVVPSGASTMKCDKHPDFFWASCPYCVMDDLRIRLSYEISERKKWMHLACEADNKRANLEEFIGRIVEELRVRVNGG